MRYTLRLFVIGGHPSSVRAVRNLDKIKTEFFDVDSIVEIIDIKECPEVAISENIFAIPTLIRIFPQPVCKIIGDLSDKEIVLSALNLKPLRT